MTPEEIDRRMDRVTHTVDSMDEHKRELAIQSGLLDRRFAMPRQTHAGETSVEASQSV